MNIHQHKKGTIELGGREYTYEYWERDWNIQGNTETENLMHTSLKGTLHEMVIDHNWEITFPNGEILKLSRVACGGSFDKCVSRLKETHLLYEIAQDSPSLDEARRKWYKKLGFL